MTQCDLCDQQAIADGLCDAHINLKNAGKIEKCSSCHTHWAKVGYGCKVCWDEELRVLGENHD